MKKVFATVGIVQLCKLFGKTRHAYYDKNWYLEQMVDDLTKVTVSIATWDAGILKGRSSGFLYKSPNHDSPLVITAGHNMPVEGSFIEIRVKNDNDEMLK